MYHRDDCLGMGLPVYPVAAGRFRGRGRLRDWRLVPTAFVISMPERGVALERFSWGSCRVEAGEVILLWPHRWHAVSEGGGRPLHTLWLELDGPGLPALAQAFTVRENAPVIHPRSPRRALTLLRALVDHQLSATLLSPTGFWRDLAALADLCSGAWQPPARRAPTMIERAEALWQSETVAALGPAELARRLGVHANTLLRAAQAERGSTMAHLVVGWKVARARTLLIHTDLKLRVVAQAAGFSSTSHLIRAVRAFTGLPPSRLRTR